MKNKFTKIALNARQAVSSAANKTTDYVRAHKPTESDWENAKTVTLGAGNAVAKEAAELGRQAAQSKTFKDAAKGAGVGALIAVPIPLVGPALGAIVGAGAGIFLSLKRPTQTQVLPPAYQPPPPSQQQPVWVDVPAQIPKDLYTELLKLDELRQKGLLTNEEFEVQKQKLIQKV